MNMVYGLMQFFLQLEKAKPCWGQRGLCSTLIHWSILMIVINAWLWNCCNCEASLWENWWWLPFVCASVIAASCVCFYACDRRCKRPWTKPEKAGPASLSPIACLPFRTLTLSPSCPGALWSRKERTTSSWPWREPTTSWLPQGHRSANCSGKTVAN